MRIRVSYDQFLRSLTGDQRRDAALIGQVGVGFYSAFIVAGRVTLTTPRAGLGRGAPRPDQAALTEDNHEEPS